MRTLALNVSGMTCGGCVRAVQNVLSRVPHVESVKVDIGKAVLTFGSGWSGDPAEAIAAVGRAGFTAQLDVA